MNIYAIKNGIYDLAQQFLESETWADQKQTWRSGCILARNITLLALAAVVCFDKHQRYASTIEDETQRAIASFGCVVAGTAFLALTAWVFYLTDEHLKVEDEKAMELWRQQRAATQAGPRILQDVEHIGLN